MENENKGIVEELVKARSGHCLSPQVRRLARTIAHRSLGLLFPHFSESLACDNQSIEAELDTLRQRIGAFINAIQEDFACPDPSEIDTYLDQLPLVHEALVTDAKAIYYGDPAASSIDEVIVAYPGFLAIAIFRLAHVLHRSSFPLLPRLMTEWAHAETGVDIHPAATIGNSFCIDHGTGIVVGETAVIGHGVKLYQGVTLGALSVTKQAVGTKRHPTIEDNVVIYANATILGGSTVIGHDSIVGGNAFVTRSVPPFSVVDRKSDVKPRTSNETVDLDFYI